MEDIPAFRHHDRALSQTIDEEAVRVQCAREQEHLPLFDRVLDDERIDAPGRDRTERVFGILELAAECRDLGIQPITLQAR